MKSEICENCGVIHKGKWFNCKKFKPKNHTLSDDIIKELMKIEIVKENVALQNAIRMNIDFYVKEFIKKLKEGINEWEYYEKRFPHKETKWNRIKMRVDKLAGEKLR